jgi:hypothetical protein
VCIIDTAPTLGNPLYAALIAADFVVCPCTMDQDAIDGLGDLFEDIARVQQLEWNADLVTLGLLANRVNTRRAFDRNALEQLRDELGEVVMEGVLYDRAATQYAKDRPVWRVQSGESSNPGRPRNESGVQPDFRQSRDLKGQGHDRNRNQQEARPQPGQAVRRGTDRRQAGAAGRRRNRTGAHLQRQAGSQDVPQPGGTGRELQAERHHRAAGGA